jgi:hypothetical protein
MPHKSIEERRAYHNAWYARKVAEDPSYRDKWNGSRDQSDRTCEICGAAFKGRKDRKTCSRACANRLATGTRPKRPDNPTPWLPDPGSRAKGWINAGGYRMVYRPDHPRADKGGRIQEHRVVMEAQLGRLLLPTETVHHKNGQRADNRPENLELWTKPQPSGVRDGETAHCATCTCAASAE